MPRRMVFKNMLGGIFRKMLKRMLRKTGRKTFEKIVERRHNSKVTWPYAFELSAKRAKVIQSLINVITDFPATLESSNSTRRIQVL